MVTDGAAGDGTPNGYGSRRPGASKSCLVQGKYNNQSIFHVVTTSIKCLRFGSSIFAERFYKWQNLMPSSIIRMRIVVMCIGLLISIHDDHRDMTRNCNLRP